VFARSWLPFVNQIGSKNDEEIESDSIQSASLPLVFKNYVHDEPKLVFRPITRLLGLDRGKPGINRNEPFMDFIPVQGNLGFHVPAIFISFLEKYGGLSTSGLPVTDPFHLNSTIYRQCFENYCLDFDLGQSGEERLSLAPLGKMYAEYVGYSLENNLSPERENTLLIEVFESENYLSSGEKMDIQIKISERGTPLYNREPYAVFTLPDGTDITIYPDPTNSEGTTFLETPPIQAPNVTLIPYKICLDNRDSEPNCINDHYLIWIAPD
jgi:hypothetical protein